MHHLRVFFAILFPEKTQDQLSNWVATLKKTALSEYIRWIPEEKMHITLQFIGALPEDQLLSVEAQTKIAIEKLPAFQLQFCHLEWFPNFRHPKILSCFVQPQSELKNMSELIGEALTTLNIPIEARPFRGHLTIGRLMRRGTPGVILDEINLVAIPPITISNIYLLQSNPEKGGQNYKPLAELTLAGTCLQMKGDKNSL